MLDLKQNEARMKPHRRIKGKSKSIRRTVISMFCDKYRSFKHSHKGEKGRRLKQINKGMITEANGLA